MMKLFLSLLVLCFVSTTLLLAQTADEKAVAAAVEKFRQAMVASDKATLENMSSEALSYGHSNALVEDRAAFLEQFVTGQTDFVNITLSNQTIKIVGNAAVVRHRLVGDTNNNKVPGTVDLIVLMVWEKQKGEWKLLARQAVKLPAKS
jgi:ketosteroid isomerase-like protein